MQNLHFYKLVIPLAVAIILFLEPQRSFRQFNRVPDDTCQNFVQSIEEADETMDRSRLQLYNDTAESIYASLNNAVLRAGVKALPLPQNPKIKANRAAMVVWQCRVDINQMYHNAVADVYVKLRISSGISTESTSN